MRLRLIISFCLLLLLFGCSTDDATRNNTFVPLTSIEVSGTYEFMANKTINQYRAIGNFSGLFTRDITTEVSWRIKERRIAVASNETGSQGLVTALSPGETNVYAIYGDISGSAPVSVTDAILAAIDITPQDALLPIGLTQQYEAVGTFSDSSTQNITPLATWVSSDPNVATIDPKGLATTLATGSITITGSWQGIEASTSLQVTSAKLNTIKITPADITIAQGTTVQFKAEGTYSDGQIKDITAMANWQSSANSVAIVDNEGLAEGISSGRTDIKATYDENGIIISGGAVLRVSDAVIQSILITPENSTIQSGETQQYTATGTFSDNTQQDITFDVTWLSNDSSVGSISNSSVSRGLFTSIASGTTFIEAFLNGVGDQTLLIVQ